MRAGMRAGMRVLAVLLCALRAGGTELTFELPDSAKQCFHQELERGLKFTLDYQVLPCPQPCPCLCPSPPAPTPSPCGCASSPHPPGSPPPPDCTGRRSQPWPRARQCPPRSRYRDVPTAATGTPDPGHQGRPPVRVPHRSCWHRGAQLPRGVPQPGPLPRGGQLWARLCTPAWAGQSCSRQGGRLSACGLAGAACVSLRR